MYIKLLIFGLLSLSISATAQIPFTNSVSSNINFRGNGFYLTNLPVTVTPGIIQSWGNDPENGEVPMYNGSGVINWTSPTNTEANTNFMWRNLQLATNILLQSNINVLSVLQTNQVNTNLLLLDKINNTITGSNILNGVNVSWGFINNGGTNRFKIVSETNEIYIDFIP